MKRFIIILFFIALILDSGSTAVFKGADAVRIKTGDTLQQDLFAGCRYLDVQGPATGDIYAAAERITIEAPIGDDVIAACRDLIIRSKVNDGVIGFAQTILIDGEIDGDVIAFGSELRLTENAHIKGKLFLGTGKFIMENARVDGNISGGSGYAYLNGNVGGNVKLDLGKVDFDSGYAAVGTTHLTLHRPLNEKELKFAPADLKITIEEKERFYQSFFFYWWIVALLITGIVIFSFFKNASHDYLEKARKDVLKSIGLGFLILVVTPIALVLLMVLVFTIPLSLILLVVYLVLLYLSLVYSALYIGDAVLHYLRKNNGHWPLLGMFALGLILVILLPEIPFIGWLINLVIICFGMGSLSAYIWAVYRPQANKS